MDLSHDSAAFMDDGPHIDIESLLKSGSYNDCSRDDAPFEYQN